MQFSHKILFTQNTGNIMANKISITQKQAYLPYIRNNFSRLSQREIARKLQIGKTTVNRWAEEMGLKFKKHTVNEEFFNKLNENSSYFLGFIYADGNIAWNTKKGYYTITITASERDVHHLEKLRALISSTKPLLYSPKTKSCRLIINSKKLCKKLMQYGLTPSKSLTLRSPDIPSDQFRHFLRGIIDGDGNVRYVNRKKSPYFEITIASGSKNFCEDLIKTIKQNICINANTRRVGKNTYVIQYSCSRGERLAEYIYSKTNIFLERKFKPYKNNIMEAD